MEIFSKDFKTEEHGQVVVMKDLNEKDKPCVNIYFKTELTEIVKASIGFKDEESRDISFNQMNIDKITAFLHVMKN